VLFGEYLCKKGLVTQKDIKKAHDLQEKHIKKIGKRARDEGLLSNLDVVKITRKQSELKSKFCETAEQLKLLTHEQVIKLIEEQKKDYIHFGEALVLSGILSEDIMKRELKLFCEEREEFWKSFYNIQ
jgi:hypothetical protein